MVDPSPDESNTLDDTSTKLDRQAPAAFGARLRLRAERRGMTGAEIGRIAGISKQSMSGYLQGLRIPKAEALFRLSKALDVDPRWLTAGEDGPSTVDVAADAPADPDLASTRVLSEVRSAGAVGFNELSSMVFGDERLPPLPLYGSAQGGDLEDDFALTELDLGEVLDHLRRPASLADDQESYALTIVGSSMSPRFKPGERVGVSPRARVEIGDDVIVQLRGENTNRVHRVLIKELVRRKADHIVLRQHNPARDLRIERTAILAMHKVKGHFL